MKKILVLLSCMALPLAVMADNGKPSSATPAASAARQAARPAKDRGARPAPVTPDEARTALRNSKNRGADMGACRKQIADKGLVGPEYKLAIVECMKTPGAAAAATAASAAGK